jgi:hypothetical protein
MSIYFWVILPVLILVLAVLIRFYFQNKKNRIQHIQLVVLLKNDISKHYNEIIFRQHHLDSYNFLKYNLSQALVVQKDINCNFN